MRNGGQGDEVVLASADWSRLMVASMEGAIDLGDFGKAAFNRAVNCR